MISNYEIYLLSGAILTAMLAISLASVYHMVSMDDLIVTGLVLFGVLALYTIRKKTVRLPSVPDRMKP